MKSNLLIRKIRIPVYRSALWIIICPSIPKAIDHIEDQINTKIHTLKDRISTRAYTYASEDEQGRRRFYLFLRPSSKPGEIAHECNHLMHIIFRWFGAKTSMTNDEPQSYYLEVLVDQAHNTINSYKKLHNKPKRVETLIITN